MVLVEGGQETNIGRNGVVASANFSEVGPADGLIGYWPMNGNLLDYSESNNDGTATGATIDTASAPRDRSCYDFTNSTADKIDLPNIITLSAGAAWSWSFWGYKDSYSDEGIGGNDTDIANGRLSFNSATQLTIETTGTAPLIPVSAFPTSTWFHFVIIHSTGNVVTVYRDGSSVGFGAANPTGDILFNRIGDNPDNSGWLSFNGLMFDFRIYDRLLTPSEINILAKTFDTDATNRTEMEIGTDTWYTFGEFKEQL